MSARPRIAVMKFGGTSVATPEQRGHIASRVRDAMASGFAPVVIVSAMGRAPAPYATDSLLALLDGESATPESDLLLACGENIAAAVVAKFLRDNGVAARAFTGREAGVHTDARYGNARIRSVDPTALSAAIEAGYVPVVTGFQGASPDGSTTTLGRGGSDLTAVAIGDALDAERIDIYTDVSGAMTADPRRIDRARTIARASLEEMAELATHGAKVMHAVAAEYARERERTYAIKGLASDRGTLVVESMRHDAPVTGVAVSDRLTWVRVIRGDIESPKRRMEVELEMFARVARAEISIDQVAINQSGVSFVVAGDRGNELRALLGDLNLAVRVREGCAKLSIVGAGMRELPGVVLRVVEALSAENVEVIHLTDSNVTISVLVPEPDAARAERAVFDAFDLAEQKVMNGDLR